VSIGLRAFVLSTAVGLLVASCGGAGQLKPAIRAFIDRVKGPDGQKVIASL